MDNLFTLIKSLKPSEKRYFKVSTSTSVKKTQYLKLFDAIDALDEYNEKTLITKHRKEKFVTHLAVNKSNLFDLILQKLRGYNEENIEFWKIRKEYYKILIVAQNGMDAHCAKLIEKAKEKAWAYEMYSVLYDIIELEMYLFGNNRIGKQKKEFLQKVQQEKDDVLLKLNHHTFVLKVWHQINNLVMNASAEPFETIKNKAASFLFTDEMKVDKGSNFSLISQNRYLACFELYYNFIGDSTQCYMYNKRIIDNRALIDTKMPKFSIDAMAVYFNYMIACYKVEKWDELEVYLLKTINYPITFIDQEIRRTHNYCYCGILLYLSTKNYEKADEVVQLFLEKKEMYKLNYRIDFLLYTQALCGYYFFIQKKYTQSTKLWREIINGPKYAVETRTQGMVRVFIIMQHIQQNEVELVDYEVKNCVRFLKKENLFEAREKLFLTQILKIKATKNKRDAYSKLYQSLLAIDSPVSEKNIVCKFILDWLLLLISSNKF